MTRRHALFASLLLLLTAFAATSSAAPQQQAETRWDFRLEGVFHEGQNPLNIYARLRGDQWVAAVGSSRIPGRNKYAFNRSYHHVDLSGAPMVNGVMRGEIVVHVTPDLWIPTEHAAFKVTIGIDARVGDDGKLAGEYRVLESGEEPASGQFQGKGSVSGISKSATAPQLDEPVTFQLNMFGAITGGDARILDRCIVLRLGFDQGKLASAMHGRLSMKDAVFAVEGLEGDFGSASYDADGIRGKIVLPATTINAEAAEYTFEFQGRIVETLIAGTYRAIVKVPGSTDMVYEGGFDGRWSPGIQYARAKDDRPWYVPVEGFKPVVSGEHPRLLFRKSDLPRLKLLAATPEGQAMIARLKAQLGGGDAMPQDLNRSKKAYEGADKKLPLGAYSYSHSAGFGLLYQLTGEQKYADLALECIELGFTGQRDRDDRYSWVAPGGSLRAGVVLGWTALAYDLAYDGWDKAARQRIARAIAEYDAGEADRDMKGRITLETLTRGSMPPGSNHFGMEVGGAAMALLAVMDDPGVDRDKIRTLLKINENSMVRNMTEGFGDGGFFAEGDGTGSMSSQHTFVTALQAWHNAMGRDYVNVRRPNARMMTLKWIYLTVVRGARPIVWPIRGAYGHNVWSRTGGSGGGYFALGMGAVNDADRAAMKWYYNRFLLQQDTAAGAPFDTVNMYPHLTVCAFVNWPFDIHERNPAEVLPLGYRDSHYNFYAWRNRWQDENDIVISILTERTTAGYMQARQDRGLMLYAFGEQITWGRFNGGVTFFEASPRWQTSVMTRGDGSSTAVDMTGASGADVMLVTTGEADGTQVKLGDITLTFRFVTKGDVPAISVKGDQAVVGKQTVSVKDGNIVLGVKGQ